MDYLLINRSVFTKYDLSWLAMLAYIALKVHALDSGEQCKSTSVDTLAATAKVTDKSIKKGLKELAAKGLIEINSQFYKSTKGKDVRMVNLYTILPPPQTPHARRTVRAVQPAA